MNLPKNKIIALVIFIFLFQNLFTQNYLEGNKLLELSFGPNADNVTYKELDVFPMGPQDFWPENDNYFYIVDAMSKKIKKFDNTENIIWELYLDSYPIYIWKLFNSNYVCLTAQSTPGERFKVVKFNKEGALISNSSKINWPFYASDVHLKCSKDKIYVQNETHAYILDYNLNNLDTLKRYNRHCYYLNEKYLYVYNIRNFQPQPEIIFSKPLIYSTSVKTNLIPFKARLDVRHNKSALFHILGIDTSSYIYLSRLDQPRSPYLVLKYSPDGELISENKIKINFYAHGPFSFKVMPNGDIYSQNSDKQKYWIEKYPAEWFEK